MSAFFAFFELLCLLFGFLLVFLACARCIINHVGRKEEFRTVPLNCLGGAYADALTALNTLGVTNVTGIHFALSNAESAVGAALFIYLYANQGDLVKESVKGTQWAKETAEQAENKYARHKDGYHQKEFPSKEGTEHTQIALVDAVGEQSHSTLKRSRGADVFAKSRQREVAEGIRDGKDAYEKDQNHIFEIGENTGDLALFELGCGNLMQKLLNEAKGAEESADPTAKQKSV